MNYYPHHIGDYDSHTAHLTWSEDLAYRRLICLYYRTEKPLVSKVEEVCRLIRAQSGQDKKSVAQVLNEFFVLTDNGWRHLRCDDEISKAQAKAERNREVGKRGGRPKKESTKVVNLDNPEITQMVSENNPNVTLPIANNQEPITKDKSSAKSPTFDDDEIPIDRQRWIQFFRDECGVDINAHSAHERTKFFPLATSWIKSMVSVSQMRQAVADAHTNATEGIAYLPAYVDRVLASKSKPKAENKQEALEARNQAVVDEMMRTLQ